MKSPLLHGGFGSIDGDTAPANMKYVYIMRMTEHGIPRMATKEDAMSEMNKYFLIGTFETNFLKSMENVLTKVHIKFLLQYKDY